MSASAAHADYLSSGSVRTPQILSAPSSSPVRKTTTEDLYLQGYGRQFGEKMTYSVGLTYGLGLLAGGSYGALLGFRKGGTTSKLMLNSVLNGAGSRGPALANQFAILTLFYVGFNSFIGFMRGEDDSVNAFAGGALSGALFKATTSMKLAARYSAASAVLFTAADQGFRSGIL